MRVSLALKRPVADPLRPRPLVILAGGFNRGRAAVELLPDTRDIAVAAFDYPNAGEEPRGLGWLGALADYRESLHDMPAALSLGLDFILTETAVDRDRIEAVGVSLGSFPVIVAGARDGRIDRVWSIHGGAGIEGMLAHAMDGNLPGWSVGPLAAFGNNLLHRLEPSDYVAEIAPRPFVLVQAERDRHVAATASQALFAAAGEPKERIAMAGGHVDGGKPEIIRQLVDLVLERIAAERPAH